jgi:hypothetical protein
MCPTNGGDMADIVRDVARIGAEIEVTHNWRITDP